MKTTKLGTPIIHITDAVYEKIAKEFTESIKGRDYFQGELRYDNGAFECMLIISSFLIYKKDECPDGTYKYLYDITPLWWELRTYMCDNGEMCPNDFEFKILKDHLLNLA